MTISRKSLYISKMNEALTARHTPKFMSYLGSYINDVCDIEEVADKTGLLPEELNLVFESFRNIDCHDFEALIVAAGLELSITRKTRGF